MAKETKSKSETFEDAYARLEAIVARLEEGGLTLDEAIDLYEQGMALARACQERLDNADQRITKLRESFAQTRGSALAEQPEDYESVAEEEREPEPDEFA